MLADYQNGYVVFSVQAFDYAGNQYVSTPMLAESMQKSPARSVKPYLADVVFDTNNVDPQLAQEGDTLSLRFTSSATLTVDPTCTFTSGGAVVTGDVTVSAIGSTYTC